jgi:hypothetical protein
MAVDTPFSFSSRASRLISFKSHIVNKTALKSSSSNFLEVVEGFQDEMLSDDDEAKLEHDE